MGPAKKKTKSHQEEARTFCVVRKKDLENKMTIICLTST
jgi:hypothetical protein